MFRFEVSWPGFRSISGTAGVFLLIALLLTQSTFAQQGSATPQSQTAAGLPPPNYIPSHDYDMRNILLNLRFDWEKSQTYGTATLSFAPLLANLKQIELDAANMTFNSIKLSSGAALQFRSDPE